MYFPAHQESGATELERISERMSSLSLHGLGYLTHVREVKTIEPNIWLSLVEILYFAQLVSKAFDRIKNGTNNCVHTNSFSDVTKWRWLKK